MVVVVLPSPQFLLQVVQRDEFMHVKEFSKRPDLTV